MINSTRWIIMGAVALRLTPIWAHGLTLVGADGERRAGCGTALHAQSVGKMATTRAELDANLTHFRVSGNGLFRVHYALPSDALASQKTHAVDPTDSNNNGTPDFVDAVIAAVNSTYSFLIELGYVWSHNDGGLGGDTNYDVYLPNLAGTYYGLAWDGSSGYLELDNDFAENSYVTPGADGARVTVAHELFHAFQFPYAASISPNIDKIGWWREATATFMEDQVFPSINDYTQYHNWPNWGEDFRFLEKPELSLSTTSGNTDVRQYGACIFPRLLSEGVALGDAALLRTYEDQKTNGKATDAVVMDAITSVTGRSAGYLIAKLWTWSYFLGSRATGGSLFSDAGDITYAPPAATPPASLASGTTVTDSSTAYGWGAGLVEFPPENITADLHIVVSQDLGLDWTWMVGIQRNGSVEVREFADSTVIMDWNSATRVVLVGGNGLTPDDTLKTYTYSARATQITDINQDAVPQEVSLGAAHPNPFNARTVIPFSVDKASDVQITIYTALGQEVRTLSKQVSGAGSYSLIWDGNDERGVAAASGAYLYVWKSANATFAGRVALTR